MMSVPWLDPPELVGVWRAVPWQDVPLFDRYPAYEYPPTIRVLQRFQPIPVLDFNALPPLTVTIEYVVLERLEYRWHDKAVFVYCERGDPRVQNALARLSMASRLINFIARLIAQ